MRPVLSLLIVGSALALPIDPSPIDPSAITPTVPVAVGSLAPANGNLLSVPSSALLAAGFNPPISGLSAALCLGVHLPTGGSPLGSLGESCTDDGQGGQTLAVPGIPPSGGDGNSFPGDIFGGPGNIHAVQPGDPSNAGGQPPSAPEAPPPANQGGQQASPPPPPPPSSGNSAPQKPSGASAPSQPPKAQSQPPKAQSQPPKKQSAPPAKAQSKPDPSKQPPPSKKPPPPPPKSTHVSSTKRPTPPKTTSAHPTSSHRAPPQPSPTPESAPPSVGKSSSSPPSVGKSSSPPPASNPDNAHPPSQAASVPGPNSDAPTGSDGADPDCPLGCIVSVINGVGNTLDGVVDPTGDGPLFGGIGNTLASLPGIATSLNPNSGLPVDVPGSDLAPVDPSNLGIGAPNASLPPSGLGGLGAPLPSTGGVGLPNGIGAPNLSPVDYLPLPENLPANPAGGVGSGVPGAPVTAASGLVDGVTGSGDDTNGQPCDENGNPKIKVTVGLGGDGDCQECDAKASSS